MRSITLVLDNIRSAQNVGSIFRTADAIGVERICLTGYTPTPLDRFGRARKDIAKAALGAERSISWTPFAIVTEAITTLKEAGYTIVAVEQSPRAVDYKIFAPGAKTALLFGNEVEGITPDTLAECDTVIEIPMRGTKESLNVTVAAGIVLYRLFDR